MSKQPNYLSGYQYTAEEKSRMRSAQSKKEYERIRLDIIHANPEHQRRWVSIHTPAVMRYRHDPKHHQKVLEAERRSAKKPERVAKARLKNRRWKSVPEHHALIVEHKREDYKQNREKYLAQKKEKYYAHKISLLKAREKYWRNRDKILARSHRKTTLDDTRLSEMLEQTEPLPLPLSTLTGKRVVKSQRSMFSPNFKVSSAEKPIKKHSWGYLESRFRERMGYAPPKPRLSRADRRQMRMDARAIKMYHKALRKPKAFEREMEKAVKDSGLMDYIKGANPE
jgi:hypothetical protein